MTSQNIPFPDLEFIDKFVFKPCQFPLDNLRPEKESQKYSALTFRLINCNILFRKAKITPSKTGQFVTLWKRNDLGITTPFSNKDDFDFYLIVAKTPIYFGIFIFTKAVLQEKKIISDESREGKRGIRVYPIWDEAMSEQARKTKMWQTQYFLDLSDMQNIDLKKAKELFKIN